MRSDTLPLLVLTTCPDPASADAIAQALVEEGLAACVTQLPGATSVYRWQGRVERASEIQLLIKTRVTVCAATLQRLAQLHPYELPEMIVVEPRDVSEPYMRWVNEQTPDR
ncbi:divalent-cation tolerance protein CutA [Lysobacter enzymogenes]|uniref:divalent-cation tolerance protein CutA n=1 Tax=Lysobacter enzymogenes TaxID=69 RepID=UPI001AFB09D6|nr:divalent-cation tolerance protein CutA [Lysobacter enzymogenes]QQQ00480.1 divalent-cation tolerance protein CutA [Lysobacter enzymogenes]